MPPLAVATQAYVPPWVEVRVHQSFCHGIPLTSQSDWLRFDRQVAQVEHCAVLPAPPNPRARRPASTRYRYRLQPRPGTATCIFICAPNYYTATISSPRRLGRVSTLARLNAPQPSQPAFAQHDDRSQGDARALALTLSLTIGGTGNRGEPEGAWEKSGRSIYRRGNECDQKVETLVPPRKPNPCTRRAYSGLLHSLLGAGRGKVTHSFQLLYASDDAVQNYLPLQCKISFLRGKIGSFVV
ncbi:hypothetical protein PENSPDRAFT_513730 [Peniophora sp. CONT]|nr:hypothetical protein PENSPDRAFT_513730 [Peniophora sp. CONT]